MLTPVTYQPAHHREETPHSPMVVFIMVWMALGLFWGLGLGWFFWA